MKLEFDSIDDLNEFLNWADLYKSSGSPEPAAPGVGLTSPVLDAQQPLQPTAGLVAGGEVAFDTPPAASGTENPDPAPTTPYPTSSEPVNAQGKPARKRRTKAEIEADEKAAAAAQAAAQEGTKAEEPAAVAQPQGANPFAQPEVDPSITVSEPVAESDPTEAVVTPFQHITRAREFIAKHQIHKYNETFAKAELDANVMAYTPEQRAKHMAVMDEFDKA